MAEQESQIPKQDLEISEPESDMKFEELKKIWEEKVPQPNEKPVREPVPDHLIEESHENRIISKVDLELIFKKITEQGGRGRRDVKILKLYLAGKSKKEITDEINTEFSGNLKIEPKYVFGIIAALDDRIYTEYEYLMPTQQHRRELAERQKEKEKKWAKEDSLLIEKARSVLDEVPDKNKKITSEPLREEEVLKENPGYKVVPEQKETRLNKILKFLKLK